MDLVEFVRHTCQLFFRLSSSRFLLPRSTIPSRNLSNTSLSEVKFFEHKNRISWKWNQTFTRFCFFPFVVFWSDLRKVLIGDPVIDCVFLTESLNPGTECLESVFLISHSETEPAGLWVEVLTPANDFCDFLNGGKWSTERILSFARSIGISDVFARALVLSC